MKSGIEKILLQLEKGGHIDAPRRQGDKNWTYDCPFHSKGVRQSSPSFGVHAETGQWNCFNPDCGRKGPSIQVLYAYLTGTPEEEAKAVFPSDAGATDDLRKMLLGSDDNKEPRIMAPFPKAGLIREYPAAVEYMERRRIPEWVWLKMGALYAPEKQIIGTMDRRTTMGGRRIIFPIRLPNGQLGFMGRSIYRDEINKWRPIENTGTFFYDPLGLLSGEPTSRSVVLVEGEFDVAACIREGLPVIGCFGARIGNNRAHLLQRFDRILMFFDGDDAGFTGAKKSLKECKHTLGDRMIMYCAPRDSDPGKLPNGFGPRILAKLNDKPSFLDTLKGKINV